MRIKEYFLYPLICKFFNLVHPSGGGGGAPREGGEGEIRRCHGQEICVLSIFLSPPPPPAYAYNLWHDRYHRHEDINRSARVSVFIIISFSAMFSFLPSRVLLLAPQPSLPVLLLLR